MFKLISSQLAFVLLISCAAATPPKETKQVRIQLAFMHFNNDQVKVTIGGNIAVDKAMTVAADNERSGIADFAQVEMPTLTCSKVTVQTKTQRLQQDICLEPETKSIIIDAGPPLTLTQKSEFQGQD
jgi:hypothetical protein